MGMIEEHLNTGPHTAGAMSARFNALARERADNDDIKQFVKHDNIMQKERKAVDDVEGKDDYAYGQREQHYDKADKHSAIAEHYGNKSGLFGPRIHDMDDYHENRYNTIFGQKDYEAGHATPEGK